MPQVRKKCPHNRNQYHCKECGGKGSCSHTNNRAQCKICKGSQICKHNRIRGQCKDCGGSKICAHGVVRNNCGKCGGTCICEHGKQRAVCRDCGGASLCQHGLERGKCRLRGGRSFCKHQRWKSLCTECGGSALCHHNRSKQNCADCNEFVCNMEGCHLTGHRFAGATALRNHMRVFHGDNPKALTRRKELEVHQLLGQAGLQFEYQHHLPFRGCGLESETQRAFADFVLYACWGAVILEVDENQHRERDASCDVRRDFDMAASVALGSAHKLAIVRYNPDAFKLVGRTVRTSKKERHARLLQLLHSLLQEEPERQFQRLFLYYDRAAEDSELPAVAEDWDVVARAVSRAVV